MKVVDVKLKKSIYGFYEPATGRVLLRPTNQFTQVFEPDVDWVVLNNRQSRFVSLEVVLYKTGYRSMVKLCSHHLLRPYCKPDI